MKNFIFTKQLVTAALVATVGLFSSCEKELDNDSFASSMISDSKQANTAQSYMVAFEGGSGVFQNEGSISYSLSDNSALRPYFMDNFTISPVTTNSGVWNAVIAAYTCDTYNGAAIVEKTFRQGSTNYTVTPKPAFLTSKDNKWDEKDQNLWTEGENNIDKATVQIENLVIAGQSVLNHKKNGTKYSFSLEDRVENLLIEILDIDGGVVDSKSLVAGDDFTYSSGSEAAAISYIPTSGSEQGAEGLLKSSGTIGEIISEGAWGNQVTATNAQVLVADPVSFTLPSGSYTVKITGSIKGNSVDGTVAEQFSVSAPAVIGAPTCN
jgi:hypothetical protein